MPECRVTGTFEEQSIRRSRGRHYACIMEKASSQYAFCRDYHGALSTESRPEGDQRLGKSRRVRPNAENF